MAGGVPDHLGPYEIRGELGRGGMGVVYRAHRADLKREFALKVIRPDRDAAPDAIERFRREARAAAKLAGHPGIVGVHDIGEADGQIYFAMTLVDGHSLEELIDDDRIKPRQAAALIRQVALALQHAHEHGVLHRDIKPANILLGRDGKARITDFGLAKAHDTSDVDLRLTRSGVMLGTPAYASPEQARGDAVDARSDVYSLGASLYEILTSEPPFTGDAIYTVLANIQRDEPRPPSRRNPRVPRDLETITLKCLEKDPGRRYQSANELAQDLARFLKEETIEARRAGLLSRIARRAGRRKATVAMGAGFLGALVLVVAYFAPQLTDALEGQHAAEREREVARVRAGEAEARAATERARRSTAEESADEERRRKAAAEGASAAARAASAEAERRASQARALAMQELARSTRTTLDAALTLRRLGHLDEMRRFATQVEKACAEAAELFPESPEPHYWQGRLDRALMRDAEAGAKQRAALERDPHYAPARYERAILLARALQVALTRARAARQCEALAAAFGSDFGGTPHLVVDDAPATDSALPHVAQLRAALTSAVAALPTDAQQGLPAAERACIAGLDAWLRGDPSSATDRIESAIDADPNIEEAYGMLASISEDEGRLAEAVRWWSRGAELDRGYLPYRAGRALARVRHTLVARDSAANGDQACAAAVADYDEALRLDPAATWILRDRGIARAVAGAWRQRAGQDPAEQYEAALADLIASDGAADADSTLSLLRGRVRMSWCAWSWVHGEDAQSHLDQAIAEFGIAIDLAPDSATGWLRRAEARTSLGALMTGRGADPLPAYDGAIADCAEALRRDPAYPGARAARGVGLRNRAVHLLTLGRDPGSALTSALEDIEAERARHPDSSELSLLSGMTRADLGVQMRRRGEDPTEMLAQGCAVLRSALTRDASLFRCWITLGRARLEWARFQASQGHEPDQRYQDAFEALDHAIALRPDDVATRTDSARAGHEWGWILHQRGVDPTEAYQRSDRDLSAALRQAPTNAELFRMRGSVRRHLGLQRGSTGGDPLPLYESAVVDARRAVDLNPDDPRVLREAAWCFGNWAEATPDDDADKAVRLGAAIEACSSLLALEPADTELRQKRWEFRESLFEADTRARRDPGPTCAGAVRDAGEDLAVGIDARLSLLRRGWARAEWAKWSLARSEDPTELLTAAIADFTEAMGHDPKRSEAWERRASAHFDRALHRDRSGASAAAERDYEAAIQDATEAERRSSGRSTARRTRGMARYNLSAVLGAHKRESKDLLTAAVDDLSSVVAETPTDGEAWRFRGDARGELGWRQVALGGNPTKVLRAALEDLDQAANRGIADFRLRRSRGRTWHCLAAYISEQGQDARREAQSAIDEYEAAIALKPDLNASLHEELVKCRRIAKQAK